MCKMICFDMDGTIANLYGVTDWLPMLQSENPTPYLIAHPMWNMDRLAYILRELQKQEWEIRIITWLSMDSSEEYKELTRAAKREWLRRYGFPYDHFHGVQYGATKADSVRNRADYAILFDDNEKVRNGWHLGEAVNPLEVDIIEYLESLLIEGF